MEQTTATENSQPASVNDVSAASGKRKAEIWSFYEVKQDPKDSKKWRAYCKSCNKSYAVGEKPKTHGTKNLIEHREKCPALVGRSADQMLLDFKGNTHRKKVPPSVYREKMARAIMLHNYPFKIVEHKGFRDFVTSIFPEYVTYTRNTAKADCIKLYRSDKDMLKEVFQKMSGRICLTSDVWTSVTKEGYISLTAHYVDLECGLQNRIINFRFFPTPHDGEHISDVIIGLLKEWGIEKKIFSLTLDNASANDAAVGMIRSRLRLNILSNGEFFHVRCCAHILNLIVQEGLKVSNSAIDKVRESVKYLKISQGRVEKFASCCKQLGLPISSGLRLDCVTRWNSTYIMLVRNIPYRNAFIDYSLSFDSGYKCCPSEEEWELTKLTADFLRPFWKITNLLSGSSYPTANLYFVEIVRIQEFLKTHLSSHVEALKEMALAMNLKFEKYWKDYSRILSIACILDPRCKEGFVRYMMKKVMDVSEVDTKVNEILGDMRRLYSEYAEEYERSSNSRVHVEDHSISGARVSSDDDLFSFQVEYRHDTTRTELDLYLEENIKSVPSDCHFDILKEWKILSDRFPILARMAFDVLSIPITTVASESAFSIGAKVINKYRSSLKGNNTRPYCVVGVGQVASRLMMTNQVTVKKRMKILSCLLKSLSKMKNCKIQIWLMQAKQKMHQLQCSFHEKIDDQDGEYCGMFSSTKMMLICLLLVCISFT